MCCFFLWSSNKLSYPALTNYSDKTHGTDKLKRGLFVVQKLMANIHVPRASLIIDTNTPRAITYIDFSLQVSCTVGNIDIYND